MGHLLTNGYVLAHTFYVTYVSNFSIYIFDVSPVIKIFMKEEL